MWLDNDLHYPTDYDAGHPRSATQEGAWHEKHFATD